MARQIQVKLDTDDLVDIQLTDKDDNVLHTITVDASDPEMPIRFAEMIKALTTISEDVEKKEKELLEKYKDIPDDEFNYEKVIDTSRFHIESLQRIIDEINAMFGEDTIDSIFAENIAVNSDYIPDEYALIEVIDKIIPAMNSIYNERFEKNKSKYNVKRRGKAGRHNLSKEDLIRQQMGK